MEKILPMRTAGTQHLIERVYRESGKFQWAREVLKNSIEAGATRIEFGIEWQAVESKGVYRRVIADNGSGMDAERLVQFFNTFGGGGKAIGGIHENFGVGSKTSLLPWNRYGVVVISWVDGTPSMVWIRQDDTTGEYGLRLFRTMGDDGESIETAVTPFRDPHSGCDWSQLKPHWIDKNGTVIVLLGDEPGEDTVLGDPSREESDLKGLSAYLNRRFWALPDGVSVYVDELRNSDRKLWPKSRDEGHKIGVGRPEARTQKRRILGASHYVRYPVPGFDGGRLKDSGTVDLRVGVRAHWYLWDGERPQIHNYASSTGFIAALYGDEIYDATTHLSTYRSFGICDAGVRSRTWIILEAAPYDESTRTGVYPRTDRNSLLIAGTDAGTPLPLSDWGARFADQMPDAIRSALAEARHQSGTVTDETWRQRLADRFGDRWRVERFRSSPTGTETATLNQTGVLPLRTEPNPEPEQTRSKSRGSTPDTSIGTATGPEPARRGRAAVTIPSYRTAAPDELGAGMLAAWAPKDPENPGGVVLISDSHPVMRSQIKFWQDQYADHLAADVEAEVIGIYGQVAVAKIAHSEKLKGILPRDLVESELRSESALTMSLLGLIAEESLIQNRLTTRFGRRKVA
jgi:hypothetical protein